MNTGQRCQTCEHWRPLFSGEAWGVRSFVDAPEAERARVKAHLAERVARSRGRLDPLDDTADLPEFDASPRDVWYPASEIPGGEDWPEWGECALTEIGAAAPSLARAIDGSRYHAVLRCHADFGCVQWRPFSGGAN